MTQNSQHAFDHREAIAHITKDDPRLAALIEKSIEFKLNIDEEQTPYESLLEPSPTRASAGKAAAKIFWRIKALGTDGDAPRRTDPRGFGRKLREAGLSLRQSRSDERSGAENIDGIVPTIERAHNISDEELVTA